LKLKETQKKKRENTRGTRPAGGDKLSKGGGAHKVMVQGENKDKNPFPFLEGQELQLCLSLGENQS
jgi:hypothetical protein